MLARSLLDLATRAAGVDLAPNYLTERDTPWLRALLDEQARFVGQKRSEFAARLNEPLPVRTPPKKLRLAAHTLDRLQPQKVVSAVPPRAARKALFHARAQSFAPRAGLVAEVAARLGVEPPALEASLFADLARERRVAAVEPELSPSELALRTNEDIVAGLLARASHVTLVARGNTRAVVRHAQLLGLICTISGVPDASEVELQVSGPYSLFKKTLIYGRALGSLVPRIAWCDSFQITATCALGRTGKNDASTVVIRSGDPLPPARELARYDSRVEERFANDFARVAPDWDLHREPRPFQAGAHLVFPDFELVHRRDPTRRFLLEIVGFWTPAYLEQKMARLREAGIENLILCVDETRSCADAKLPRSRVVPFRKRIDPERVREICEAYRFSTGRPHAPGAEN